jgi:ATP-dependent DNA ligase
MDKLLRDHYRACTSQELSPQVLATLKKLRDETEAEHVQIIVEKKDWVVVPQAIVCDENGLGVFELIRRHFPRSICLRFKDLRRRPIETRKALLAKLLKGSHLSLVLNEHYEEDGAIVFREACKLGCEGIVSKRLGSIYRRGRSPLWLKVKNPNAPAVKREAEEDWGR